MAECHYCGLPGANTRDHIIPRSRGGPSDTWNLVPACERCNHAKGAKWPHCRCAKCKRAMWIYGLLKAGRMDLVKKATKRGPD